MIAKSSSSFVLDPFGGRAGGECRWSWWGGLESDVAMCATIFEDEDEDEDENDSAPYAHNTH
jgi:hypothetical protein